MDEEDHMVIKSIDTDGTIIVEVCLLSITANVNRFSTKHALGSGVKTGA
jgi:hypothetical protein